MSRRALAVFILAGGLASMAQAAPVLRVADSYANNLWAPPLACVAGTGLTPGPGCAPSVTTITGTPSGFRLGRTRTTGTANGFTASTSLDNGVLAASVEGSGVRNVVARARFIENYTYAGPASTPFLVPFHIDRFSLGTSSSAIGDLQQAQMLITINIISNNVLTNVATLDYRASSNSTTAFTSTLPPTPLTGVSLVPGFLAFAGVTVANSQTFVTGPGGAMTVDLGTFAAGQAFKLDYRMSCRSTGTGAGSSFCRVGDPFTIPSGPGFNLAGLATPSNVPEPATWAMLIIGFGAVGLAMRRRPTAIAA
jgi:hypothetical protein